MKLSAKIWAQGLWQALKASPTSSHYRVIENFWRALERKGQKRLLAKILINLRQIQWKSQGAPISVFTRYKLNNGKLKYQVIDAIRTRFSAIEKTPVVFFTDNKMLGGFRVKWGDLIFDASVDYRLRKLKENI